MEFDDPIKGKCRYVLDECEREIKVLDHGRVVLENCSPSICPTDRDADYIIVRAARTSYGRELKTIKQDIGLINYLMRHKHTSPFEFVRFTFLIECPLFVGAQIKRHRTANINEFSARYSEMEEKFYVPDEFRMQNDTDKQGSDGTFDPQTNEMLRKKYRSSNENAFKTYNNLLEAGVSRELARGVLPTSTYTRFYLSFDLNNLFKFLVLRMDEHTQYETRMIANAMYQLARQVAPTSFNAWNNYLRNGLSLTKNEVQAISDCKLTIEGVSKNENNEYKEKLKKMQLVMQ